MLIRVLFATGLLIASSDCYHQDDNEDSYFYEPEDAETPSTHRGPQANWQQILGKVASMHENTSINFSRQDCDEDLINLFPVREVDSPEALLAPFKAHYQSGEDM